MKRTQRLTASHLLIRLSSLVECSFKSLCNHRIDRRVVLLNSIYIELCYSRMKALHPHSHSEFFSTGIQHDLLLLAIVFIGRLGPCVLLNPTGHD